MFEIKSTLANIQWRDLKTFSTISKTGLYSKRLCWPEHNRQIPRVRRRSNGDVCVASTSGDTILITKNNELVNEFMK